MSVACQISKGKNAINIHDKDFNDLIDYEIRLTDRDFCFAPVIVNVDSVFLCKSDAKINFILPCMNIGSYKLEVVDKGTSEVIYTLNSIYY